MAQDATKKHLPGAGQRSVLGAVILLIAVVLVGVFTRKHEPTPIQKSASKRSEPRAEAKRAPIDASAPSQAPHEAGTSATPRTADASLPPPVESRPSGEPRSRSMFANAPGYVPPDDPESLSVVTGRRDAPPIDMEVTGGAHSQEALARLLLEALQVGDEHALHALRLTRAEFSTILWPELPESRPITHITVDDAWEMSNGQSLSGVSRAVSAYGSHQLEFVRLESSEPIAYRNFSLLRQVIIVCQDWSTGGEVRLKFASSFLERHGRYKVVTFRD
jgi:hypothetical protein